MFLTFFVRTCRVTCFAVQKSLKRLYSMLILRFSCRSIPLLLSATFLRSIFVSLCMPFLAKHSTDRFTLFCGRLRPFEGVYGEGTPLNPPQTLPQTLRKIFYFFSENLNFSFFRPLEFFFWFYPCLFFEPPFTDFRIYRFRWIFNFHFRFFAKRKLFDYFMFIIILLTLNSASSKKSLLLNNYFASKKLLPDFIILWFTFWLCLIIKKILRIINKLLSCWCLRWC